MPSCQIRQDPHTFAMVSGPVKLYALFSGDSAVRMMAAILVLALAACATEERPVSGSDQTSERQNRPDTKAGTVSLEDLRINDAALEIIKASEGLRLEAYTLGGRRYIGYGHQMAPGEPARITEAEATRLLREDVREAEAGVRRVLTRPVNENQFSAMVSLAYNLGVGGFARSSVLERVNAGDFNGAADAFNKYVKAGGRVLDALKRRREKERALFLMPVS